MPAACNLCDEALHEAITLSDLSVITLSAPSDANCTSCGSRPRGRMLRCLFTEYVAHRAQQPAVALRAGQIGGTRATRRLLEQAFAVQELTVGESGELDGESPDGPFHLLAAVYLPPHCDPATVMYTLIDAVEVGGLVMLHVPSSAIGRLGPERMLERFETAGAQVSYVPYRDPFTDIRVPWFLARRIVPARPLASA